MVGRIWDVKVMGRGRGKGRCGGRWRIEDAIDGLFVRLSREERNEEDVKEDCIELDGWVGIR